MAISTDALIIMGIVLIITTINRSVEWLDKPKVKDYALMILFSILIAITIEYRALSIGRWAYKEIMPTIFGIGISPLVQLFITGILSMEVARRISK